MSTEVGPFGIWSFIENRWMLVVTGDAGLMLARLR